MLKSWLALPTTQTIDKPTCRDNSILVGLTNYQHWSGYNQDEALCKKYNYDLRHTTIKVLHTVQTRKGLKSSNERSDTHKHACTKKENTPKNQDGKILSFFFISQQPNREFNLKEYKFWNLDRSFTFFWKSKRKC